MVKSGRFVLVPKTISILIGLALIKLVFDENNRLAGNHLYELVP